MRKENANNRRRLCIILGFYDYKDKRNREEIYCNQ